MSGPIIGGTYASPQAVTDGQGFAAFGDVTLNDSNANGPLTATITMTNAGTATDDNGTLTGGGLTKPATGIYTLTADSPADLQAALRAVVFTPAIIGTQSPGGIYKSTLNTGLTLQVSDGVAPAVSDTNTIVYTLPGSQPLSLDFAAIPGAPNEFSSESRTGETSYATTPVSQTADASATTITAVLNGETVYQQSFDVPYSDPAVQAAVAQANSVLAANGATASLPALTSSQMPEEIPYTATVLTGEQIASPAFTVNTNFGPGQIFGVMDINGAPNSTFTLESGQVDINTNLDYQQTIDQTATTTTPQLTAQDYTITGTPVAGPVISGTYTSPQAVTDGQPFNAFANVTLADAGSSGAETATITMTNAGTATDHNGTLTGAGLTKTATGTYMLTAASPKALQAALRAVVFTPTELGGTSNLATGLTLQVSDGVAPAVTDTNTVIYTLLGSAPLSAMVSGVPKSQNEFTSVTRTGETSFVITPVSQTATASETAITAVYNGQTVFQQSFDLPYFDPAVQAAVAQANEILASDGATASLPALTSSQVTDETPQNSTVITGEQVSSPAITEMTYFGPGPLFTDLDINGMPNTNFAPLAGQEDTNVNTDYQTTIDQTVTTTTTQLTTQDYTITGTPESTACFAAGTRILTPDGEIRVENLTIGDTVITNNGKKVPIIWIGKRFIDLRRHPHPQNAQPILFYRHCFADGVPSRDLLLSPDHALLFDEHLIPAKALVNGHTIRQLNRQGVTYYHIELPEHAVLLAEAAAAESYFETGNRAAFENSGPVVFLHPDFAQTMREQKSCAPFAESGPAVEAVRQRLLDRAGIETTCDPHLRIRYAEGAAIISSRAAIPGEIFADPRDRRRLGVKIARLEIAGATIAIEHPALVDGWHDMEPDGRWTDGRAVVPQSLLDGANVHVILVATLTYPVRRKRWAA